MFCLAPPDPIHGGPCPSISSIECHGSLLTLPDLSPRWRRTVGQAQPAEASLMFPTALSALRPTARQRRESGAKGCDHSGTFRPRNRIPDYWFFPQAIRGDSDLWHSGGAPPRWRPFGWGPLPNQPLVCSVSHRIATPRQHAPACRGTDPPGAYQLKNEMSPPAPGGVEGVGMFAGPNFNPVGVVDLSPG